MNPKVLTCLLTLLTGIVLTPPGTAAAQVVEPGAMVVVSPNVDLVHQQAVTIDVSGLDPDTAFGTAYACGPGADLTQSYLGGDCQQIGGGIGSDDFSLNHRIHRSIRPWMQTDCAFRQCQIVYRGFGGSQSRPIIEQTTVDLNYAAAPPVLSNSSLDDLRLGDIVTVAYQPFKEMPEDDPDRGVTITPYHHVGICQNGYEFAARTCSDVILDPDLRSGTVEFDIEGFRPHYCLTSEYGCSLMYYYGYEAVHPNGSEVTDLHVTTRLITFAQEESINNGNSTAPAGSPVTIETVGSPTDPAGAVAFAMICGLDGGGLDTLFCSPDIGTVELDFDGEFSGSITLPASITNGDARQDCTLGRGCLVVFAVIDQNIQPIYGFGHWVRAISNG